MNNDRGAIEVPDGTKGFDCNVTLDFNAARAFMSAGYRFVCRYVPRVTAKATDLTKPEVAAIHAAGLAIMPVQHVEMPGWTADREKGTRYGITAATQAAQCGVALGTCVWLDLEGVGPDADSDAAFGDREPVIAYCNAWFAEVGRAGYTPGLYVGYHARLTADELYHRLTCEHYWGAYNLNADERPAVRGLQMRQHLEQHLAGVTFDPDDVMRDAKGGLPLAFAPAEWDA